MRYAQRSWKKTLTLGLIGLLVLIALPLSSESAKTSANSTMAPSIKITLVPRRGTGGGDDMGTIGGTASGVDFNKCKIIIFAHTDQWYVQPYVNSPYTSIAENGKWENDTFLGYEYAALLVKSGYKPPAKTRVLPQVGGDVLDTARAQAK